MVYLQEHYQFVGNYTTKEKFLSQQPSPAYVLIFGEGQSLVKLSSLCYCC